MQYRFRSIILFVLLMCSVLVLQAVPARRIAITVTQPDGSQLVLTMRGDEHFHWLVTADGVPVVRNGEAYYYALLGEEGMESSGHLAHERSLRTPEEQVLVEELDGERRARGTYRRQASAKRSAASGGVSEVPTRGEVRVPVLLVQYADVKFSSADPKSLFEERVNGENYTAEGGHGSIKEYFVDQSDGQFNPQFDIIGPITLDHEMKYYGGNDKEGSDLRPREMVSEACRKAYSAGDVNFGQYDNNSDGYVDIIYVIYAGYGEASYPDKLEDTVWPHQWQLETPLTYEGVKLSRYACNNELDGYDGAVLDGIGTFCHEFSHCLGLPDFYDTSSGGTAFGMNVWSIMDYGCYNNNGHTPCGYTAYEKDFLGWRPLVELRNPTNVTLRPQSEGGEAYKIVNEANPNEFYVLEYLRKEGWNAYAPAGGMLILHVDYQPAAWTNNVVNNDPTHQRMTLIPADGKLDGQTLATDVWPGKSGNTALTATSTPAAKVYAGGYMNKDITNISMADGEVTFSFMQGALTAPELHVSDSVGPSGFAVAWDTPDSIAEYEVRLDRLEENPYLIDENFNKVKKGSADIGSSLDTYTKQAGWMGKAIYGLDEAIRLGSTAGGGALMTPQLTCDSTTFTVIFTIRKSSPGDSDAFMVMAVGDQAWGNNMYGYGLTVDDKVWGTYFVVMDTIGDNSFLYLDTRDNEESPEKESLRVDIDNLFLLPGDRTEELIGDDEEDSIRGIRPVKIAAVRNRYAAQAAKAVEYRTHTAVDSSTEDGEGRQEKRYDEVPVYVGRVKDSCYVFSELDGGLYRCRVRSVKDGVMSHYSNTVEVQLVDTMLPRTDTIPQIYIHRDSMYMQAADSVAIYYTVDGSQPTAYSSRYTGPFFLGHKMNIRAIARRMGHRSSEVVNGDNWFVVEGATYRVTSTIAPAVVLSEAKNGNGASGYAGHYTFGNEVKADSVVYVLKGIDSHAFRDAVALRSVVLTGDSLCSVGDSLFHGCTALNAVMWDVAVSMKADVFDQQSYHNMLLYLPDTMTLDNPLVGAKRMTIVKNGRSGALVLDNTKGFYCPQPFVAEQVSYQRVFTQNTGIETSAGWETIALPFDVQHAQHLSKGSIAPFGVEADNHFWLGKLEGDTFVPATAIRANVPYIIAMPNNSAYGEHAMPGTVTFSAEEAMIYATEEADTSVGTEFMMVPAYEAVEADAAVYALNLNTKHGAYAPGSVFVTNKYNVRPFSAYLVPAQNAGAPMYRISFAKDEPKDEEHILSFEVSAREGVVYIITPNDCMVPVYDMAGRRVCVIACKSGVNEVTSLEKGLYIIETTKVYVGR